MQATSPEPSPGGIENGERQALSPEQAEAQAAVQLFNAPPGELDLFAFVLLLRAHWWRIALFTLLGLAIALGYSYYVKPRYTSVASAIVPQGNTGSVGLALQNAVSGLDLLGGGGNDVYVDILRSRAVALPLVRQYGLVDHYTRALGVAYDETGAVAQLGARSIMVVGREGLLHVIVEDEDPKLAAELANSFLVQLDAMNQHLAITSAGQQRRYYEHQMDSEKTALEEAEIALQQSQERTGVLEPTLQAQADLGAAESLRAQLRAKQVQRDALLQGETPQNPEVVRVDSEIARLEGQLRAVASTGGAAGGTPVTQLPAQVTAHIRAAREVKFHETLFDLLERGYTAAKEQEAKDFSQIQVLDPAIPSEAKTWPPRKSWITIGLLAGFVTGIALTLIEAFVRTIMLNPVNRARYRALARGRRIA